MRILLQSLRDLNRLNKIGQILFQRNQSSFEAGYNLSIAKPEEFWGPKADLIEWFKRPEKIFDPNNSPYQKWYAIRLILRFSQLKLSSGLFQVL